MSLIELLVEKKIILVGLGLTGSLLMLAILIAVLAAVRRANAARMIRLQRQQRQRRVVREIEPEDDEVLEEIAVPARAVEMSVTRLPKPSVLVQTAPETPAPEPTDTDEPEMSDAMRDIIESVFMDEELFAHYEILLRNTTPVMIGDLVTLSQNVAAKLRRAS